ncbi:MAG: outer membrane protein assembly factor, partial [Gammaproteobacteria bacterium]|nr:outer membrane protein assembly factor [Gammaproteobacteria bacterium]
MFFQKLTFCLLWFGCISASHAQVMITGVDQATLDNVLAFLRLDDEPCDAPDWRIRRLFVGAEDEIREALEVVGYYDVVIEQRLERNEECWLASFDITL